MIPALPLLVVVPWAGAALIALLPRRAARVGRVLALCFSLSALAIGLRALSHFRPEMAGYQFAGRHDWIGSLGIRLHWGVDGLGLLLVLLTGVVGPAALLASWKQADRPALFDPLFLFLQGSALGVFVLLDFAPWFLCWELSLVPAFFLIKLGGGSGASRAAYQFFIYTMAGSAFLLLGFAALGVAAGTLDFEDLARLAADGTLAAKLAALGSFWPKVVFLGIFLGLAVKAPLFPFHTWLPPAYAEAPTGAAMFLSAVMSKMGVYGFFRILWPLFPGPVHSAAPLLLVLALAGAVLGAFAAMRQTDLKRMLAYSSLNHVSYCLLALFAAAAAGTAPAEAVRATAALSGSLLEMFNHGISAAALFACIGALELRGRSKRGLDDFGGARSAAPIFAGLCGFAMFSSIGLPGLGGFPGEFLIFRGVFGLEPWAAAIGCLGLLATALFLLTFWQRVFHGPRAGAVGAGFGDLSGNELAVLVPLAALTLLMGVFPQLLIRLFNPLVTTWAALR